ncbi:filamentous hemagglutinin N-terminal domain-containing protein [Allocoleopsis sp.]|uniref:two-partner secretion domain-containing protein n=1 Tax=Allocoleopsis sp. TaxID=3088169 RepID=UPI002FD03954
MKAFSGLRGEGKRSIVSFLVPGGAIIRTGCYVLKAFRFSKALRFAGILWAIAMSGEYAWGQVVSDDTLGSQVTSPRPGVFQIEGGATRGANLFHSFSQFSVPTGGSAYFNNNQPGIQNILARVTSGFVSNIDGLITANGQVNLFLINPNGIIFGNNAKLNINGSFIGTTANSVLFSDGTQFSTTDTQTQPILTVNVPIGLQLGNNPAPIKIQGSNLEVKPNQNLVLVGGEVSLDKGKLTAPGGRIELGGLSTAGKIGLNDNGSLNFPSNVALSDVSISNGAAVNVRAGGGGFITINARNLAVLGGSRLIAGIGKNLGIPEAQAGDVVINASDRVSFERSRVENQLDQNALGNAGSIEITSGSLFLSNGASLNASIRGEGNGGKVIIRARDTISLDGSFILSRVEPNAEGNSGGIDITTGILSLVNQAGLSATTHGKGNAGQVMIRASDRISMTDESFVNSRVASNRDSQSGGIVISTQTLSLTNKASLNANVDKDSHGNAGDIDITTDSLSLSNGASLNANTGGVGNGGKVIIRASDTISLDGGFISSRVEPNAVGNSGGIDITTRILSLVHHAGLSATTEGTGNAGQVIIRASDRMFMTDGSFVNSRVAPNGQGHSGDIVISAETLSLTNKASLSTNVDKNGQGEAGSIVISTRSLSVSNKASLNTSLGGVGNAGQVSIYATDSISLDGGFVSSKVEENAVGNAGGIDMTTGRLSLVNQAGLSATTHGKGDAGEVILRASDRISMTDGSFVNSRVTPEGQGNAGGIHITTQTLALTNDAILNVGSFGQGNAGNIAVVADSIRLDNGATINANTQGGQGNINLTSGDLVLRHGSRITTNASGSNVSGGNITIDTGVLAALENSDISANSHDFRGGNVNITAQGILGTKFRPQLTPESDITATGADSSLNGTVTLNTPDADPSQGLATLSAEPVNVEIAQDCQADEKQASIGFFNTGRGGLAPNPYEPISSNEIWEDVASSTQGTELEARAVPVSASPATAANPIVEAQGWVVNAKGEVVLVAQMPAPHSQGRCRLR